MKKIHIRKPTYWLNPEYWISYCGKKLECLGIAIEKLDDKKVCKICRKAVLKEQRELKP